MNDDPYEVLGIGREASAKDIRQRYLALARRYHPDVNGGDGTAEGVFKHVQHAYDSLRGHDGASGPALAGRPRSRREPTRANRNGTAEHDGDGAEPREYWKHRREERRDERRRKQSARRAEEQARHRHEERLPGARWKTFSLPTAAAIAAMVGAKLSGVDTAVIWIWGLAAGYWTTLWLGMFRR